MGTKNQEENIQ